MAKKSEIIVKDVTIKAMAINGIDYIYITDIARKKNWEETNGLIVNRMRTETSLNSLTSEKTLNNPYLTPLNPRGISL